MDQPYKPPPPRQHLTILEHCLKVYKLWHEHLPHIQKISRYTLGEKIDRTFVELFELLFTASKTSKGEKYVDLKRASATLELLKFFLQILWETKDLDTKKYTALSESLAEIGKMLGGWLRQTASQSHPASTNK